MTNLHQNVTVDELYELFGLRSTNYIRNNGPPADIYEELLKLHGIDFHDNPLVI